MPFFLIKYIPGIFIFLWYFVFELILLASFLFFYQVKFKYLFSHKAELPDQISVLEEELATRTIDIIVVFIFIYVLAYFSLPLFRRLIKKYLQKILCTNLNSISIPEKYIQENSPLPPSHGPSNKLFPLLLETSFKQYFFNIQLVNSISFLPKRFIPIT